MKARFLYMAVIATAIGGAFGQTPSRPHWVNYWDDLDSVFVPESVKSQTWGMGLDVNHDYSADALEILRNNPDAPYLCAALAISHPMRTLPKNAEVRAKESELCKAYVPTQQQIEEVRKVLHPPPPPRRLQISNQVQLPASITNRWVGRVYYPPPASPMEWAKGAVSGRDYRADLEAEFNEDPLIVAKVCTQAELMSPEEDVLLRQRQAVLKTVCDAFPDAKIEAAFKVRHEKDSRAWLIGLLNSSLDEAASFPPEQRRQKEEDALQALSQLGGAMTTRFEAALRILVLAPDDWRGVDAVLQHIQEASWSSAHNATPEVVLSWLADVYTKHAAAGADRWDWKRGQRAFLTMTGHLQEARTVAEELAHAAPDQHSLDLIYLASIDRVLGNRAVYDKLMSNCPAPDAAYVRLNGKPARAVKYCEDIASGFARAAREHLHGASNEAFAEIVMETNRVAPAIPKSATAAQAPTQSPEGQTDDWFIATLKAQSDRVAPMTKVQREETYFQVSSSSGVGISSLTKAAYFMFLEPWRESAAAAMLSAANSQGTSTSGGVTFDKARHVRQLVTDYYRKRAASGPEAEAWKRGLRAVLLFNGDYTEARALSRQLLEEHNQEYEHRDRLLFGLMERIFGDRKPLDQSIANCPAPSKLDLERWGAAATADDKSVYCRFQVLWNIYRASFLAPRNTLPHAYTEFLQESAQPKNDEEMRAFAADDLQHIDLDLAKTTWLALLNTPGISFDTRTRALWSLAWISEQKKEPAEAIRWADDYIATKFKQPVPFSPDLWPMIAAMPESPGVLVRNTDAFELRFRMSLATHDFANARRTIEDLATFTVSVQGLVFEVRQLLLQLADAEASAGQRQEPLRILGFIAKNPLDSQLTALADVVRAKLKAEPKREDTPWDSPARPFLKPRPNPTNGTVIST